MDTVIRRFVDRHRCQLGFDILDQPGRLRVLPKVHPMKGIFAWILFIHLLIIGIVAYLELWNKHPYFFPLFVGAMVLEFPTFLALLTAMNNAELAKGPLLEVDTSQREVALLRDQKTFPFANIEAIYLLVGWYGWTDWERVGEMTLMVQSGEDHIEGFPVVLHNDVKAIKLLAERVAELTGKPFQYSKLSWKERQRNT